MTRSQLLERGYGPEAIRHRVRTGRLHTVRSGVYAVGWPRLTEAGRWLAAVLTCGPHAVLSHSSAAALWGIGPIETDRIEVSVPIHVTRRRKGVLVHRRTVICPGDVTRRDGIPVTTPICTLIDAATQLGSNQLEAAINEADKHGLTNPEELRAALDGLGRRPGTKTLRDTLDRRTLILTDSELERLFLRLTRETSLPDPETGRWVNGFKADFYWPRLRLVVETDGLRYHRTPAQQARDRIRDQAHTAAGLTPLRFTHAQVKFEPDRVRAILLTVARRLQRDVSRDPTKPT